MTSRRFPLLGLAPLLVVVANCSGAPSQPAQTPSVLVTTERLAKGVLPTMVEAYGGVSAAPNAVQTVSAAQAGQVSQLLVAVGASVRAGQAMVVFTTAPAAQASFRQAQATLAAAQKQRAATARLLGLQLATRDQLIQADKAVSDASTTLAALGADHGDQAVQTLTAPFDGVVTAISVAQGDRTQPGASLVSIARGSGLVVAAGVDPGRRAQLQLGQPVVLSRLSGGPGIAGKVVRIGGALNPRTRLVDVDIVFPTGVLLLGESLRALITVGQTAGWVTPHRAVVTAGGPPRVFQLVGGKAKAFPVTILLSSPSGDVLDGPLDPAHPLIVDGAYQVSEGDAVRSGGS